MSEMDLEVSTSDSSDEEFKDNNVSSNLYQTKKVL